MSIKLKALGLGILAAMAVSAVAVMNASAESQAKGHFTCEVVHCIVTGEETPPTHHTILTVSGFEKGITCEKNHYHGTFPLNVSTVTSLSVTPTFIECHTEGSANKTEVTVHMNECNYVFTQPNKNAAATEHTVALVCPAGKSIVITHPECEMTIPSTPHLKGIGYTTIGLAGKTHAITLTSNVTGFNVQFHKGFCVLLGTNHTGTLSGSVTVKGLDTLGNQVGLTATGSVS